MAVTAHLQIMLNVRSGPGCQVRQIRPEREYSSRASAKPGIEGIVSSIHSQPKLLTRKSLKVAATAGDPRGGLLKNVSLGPRWLAVIRPFNSGSSLPLRGLLLQLLHQVELNPAIVWVDL